MLGVNVKKGLITDPKLYLSNAYGLNPSELSKTREVHIEGVSRILCEEYGNHGNCTLVAMTNILSYISNKVFTDKAFLEREAYETVQKEAVKLFYNPNLEKGLNVLMNRRFGKRCTNAFFGNTGVFAKTYFAGTQRLAYKLLDTGYPFILSIAFGVYFNHSVTIVGYKEFTDKKTQKRYTFLMTHDGWTKEERYIPWKNAGWHWPACITALMIRK